MESFFKRSRGPQNPPSYWSQCLVRLPERIFIGLRVYHHRCLVFTIEGPTTNVADLARGGGNPHGSPPFSQMTAHSIAGNQLEKTFGRPMWSFNLEIGAGGAAGCKKLATKNWSNADPENNAMASHGPSNRDQQRRAENRTILLGWRYPLFMVLKAFETFETSICNVWSQEVSPHEWRHHLQRQVKGNIQITSPQEGLLAYDR